MQLSVNSGYTESRRIFEVHVKFMSLSYSFPDSAWAYIYMYIEYCNLYAGVSKSAIGNIQIYRKIVPVVRLGWLAPACQ